MTTQELKTSVVAVVRGEQNLLFINDLDAETQSGDSKIRDWVRQTFFNNGVEVEFSGKGPYEKGVVIDLDTDRMQELGLSPDVLRFGQTVVRVSVKA